MTDQQPPVRTVPWFNRMQAFKRRYEKFHPATQMIGLQLWLPLVFVILFCLCYVGAFHSISPHEMKVGVVGEQTATQVDSALAKAAPGGFDVREMRAADTQAVRKGELVAIFDPTTQGGPTLVIGTAAAGSANVSTVEATFRGISAAAGNTLQIKDIAPLPHSDATGTVALYVSLVGTIGGYMVGMFCGMMGNPLRRRDRFAILGGSAVVLSLVASVLVGPVLGALVGHFLSLWALLFCTVLAVGLAVNGIAYYLGRFVTGGALVIFVFLNIPASGGAMPVDMVPEPFRWLNHVVVSGGTVPLIKDIWYGAGPGAHIGVWRLAAYAAIGLVLAIPGPRYVRWRHHRRTLLGLPAGGMMGHAQAQLMAAAQRAAAPATTSDSDAGAASGSAVEAEAVLDEADADQSSASAASGGSAVG
ncbi:ABC transporter permease [Nocardioides sp. BP30]|uniref:ABC transporter permease n=1 Tax=Nocardioides sp. BP30 TaxID=3036374 RepID=UPI0024689205|nr:ABC transporter permease [Nocardioides sp. BP30]WGL52564.1 ABC transporter permease [Nocardioides sp. BP30]